MVCIPCILAPLIPVILILWKFIQPYLQKLGFGGNLDLTANCPISNSGASAEKPKAALSQEGPKEQEVAPDKKQD